MERAMEGDVPWHEFASAAPDLAAAVERRLRAEKHHVLATLRRDGSPRVSGTEVELRGGELLLGSMPDARKAMDLLRDPRFALHAHTGDSTMAEGDAKLAGHAVPVTAAEEIARFVEETAAPEPFHLFRCTLTEVVLTSVDGEELVVRSWHAGRGERTVRRR